MRMPPLELRRWSRADYDRMIARGAFDPDDRIELLDGLMVVKERQTPLHAATVSHIQGSLRRTFGNDYHVRVSAPIALDDTSEPDLAVVRGRPDDYLRAHPATAVLLVEVADTTLAKDRLHKMGLYARAGIADYWIVNAVEKLLEVYGEPHRAPGRRYGWQYRNVTLPRRDAVVSPLAMPRKRIRVADLLVQ